MHFTCASYNIHRCFGRDGKHDQERIRRVIRELNADIIALQEVDLLYDAPNLLDYLCDKSEWKAIAGVTLMSDTGYYGNAMLTKFPIISTDRIDLSISKHEPRGAIHTTLECYGNKIQFTATHLGLWPNERRIQVLRLLDLLQSEVEKNPPPVSILIGDINEWFLWGRPLRWLHNHFKQSPRVATFPSCWPILSLDRIWVEPRQKLVSVKSWKSKLSHIASDHLPLIASIDI